MHASPSAVFVPSLASEPSFSPAPRPRSLCTQRTRGLLVETHGPLVGELLGDGEAVGVPVAAARKKQKKDDK